MRNKMISIGSKPLNDTKQSQSLQDVTNDYYKDLRRPRRVKFYKNGDRYYTGKQVMITPNRYLSFKELKHDLSRSVDLPYGVRRIYTPTNGHEVREIDDLVDGSSYVCGSFEPFKAVKYGEWPDKPWNGHPMHQHKHDNSQNTSILPSINAYNNQANGNLTSQGYYLSKNIVKGLPSLNNSINKRGTPGPFMPIINNTKQGVAGATSEQWSKPRLITIVKAGDKPRKKISILLNRKAIHNYEQFICDISDAFGLPQWRNDKIRKLYTIRGRRVQGISDFFRDDELFIGISGKETLTNAMVQDLLEEVYPNNPYAQNLMKEWEKVRKVPINLNDSKNTQRDSGYADEDEQHEMKDLNESRDARDSKISQVEEAKKKKKKKKENDAILEIENQRQKDQSRVANDDKRGKRDVLQAISEKNVQKYGPTYVTVIKHGSFNDELNNTKDENSNKKRRKPKVKKPIVFQYDMENQPQQQQTQHQKDEMPIQPIVLPKIIETPRHKEQKTPSDATPRKLKRQISSIRHVEERYEVLKMLGDGNFAVVKQARNKESGHEYALKIIDKSKMKGKEHMIDNEIQIMRSCNHPNIVKLYEDFETPSEVYLITELVKGGDLFDAITQSVKFNEKDSAGMVKDLCEALFYLHSKTIVHRDLKPENLLVMRRKDGSISIKLADFGLAMEVKEPIYTVCGTPTYVAPEILAETGYGLEVDMWACGVITYILLCGFPPFRSLDRNQEELFQYIQAGEFEYLMPYWEGISDSSKDLIDHLLVVDIKKRWRAEDVLCHPWILSQGYSKELPTNFSDYRKELLGDLRAKGRQYASEPLYQLTHKRVETN